MVEEEFVNDPIYQEALIKYWVQRNDAIDILSPKREPLAESLRKTQEGLPEVASILRVLSTRLVVGIDQHKRRLSKIIKQVEEGSSESQKLYSEALRIEDDVELLVALLQELSHGFQTN